MLVADVHFEVSGFEFGNFRLPGGFGSFDGAVEGEALPAVGGAEDAGDESVARGADGIPFCPVAEPVDREDPAAVAEHLALPDREVRRHARKRHGIAPASAGIVGESQEGAQFGVDGFVAEGLEDGEGAFAFGEKFGPPGAAERMAEEQLRLRPGFAVVLAADDGGDVFRGRFLFAAGVEQ